MEEQSITNGVHGVIKFTDVLGNVYYEEHLFTEEECQHIEVALSTFSGKTPFDSISTPAKDLAVKILTLASDTFTNACMNDFDRATQLLIAVRKQQINQEINDEISIAIKEIAEFKQLAPPFAISSSKAYEAIASAFHRMPPMLSVHIGTYNQLKWDYLNKRRAADYGKHI